MDGIVSSGYHEFKFWSPTLGQDAARIYVFDDRGGEFFMIVPDDGGKVYRDVRNAAVEAIEVAIQMGRQPGEVRAQ